ncbi:transcriptional regulator, LysR family [Shimia gijangensis]|uniref:Transcriptional regulator, LysR family n=1 Tax=Shimia gijangensis TaxID=1470563 RepID=A0A1M6U1F6_9RHOB|nr:transcriptional regulator, LysR family [Shimia gijangensis]
MALAANRNFRIASEQRNVSQPAFSRRIQALEAWVGTPLVDRGCQPICLTEAGENFAGVAQDIVSLAYQTREDIVAKISCEKEKIRFSTLSTLAQFFMPAWLKQLQPFIDTDQFIVRTDFGTIAQYLGALEENVVDLFVCYEDPNTGGFSDAEKLSSLILGQEVLVPVVAPDATGAPLWWLPDRPTDPIPYLHTASTLSLWPVKGHLENTYGDLIFTTVYETSIATAMKAMAIEGYGVAWIPGAIVADDLAQGRLVRAAGKDDDLVVDIKIYRCTAFSEPKIEAFWQALLKKTLCSEVQG